MIDQQIALVSILIRTFHGPLPHPIGAHLQWANHQMSEAKVSASSTARFKSMPKPTGLLQELQPEFRSAGTD